MPVAAGVAAAVNFFAWLGWGRHKTLGSDGYLHGPYESWQVVGLVAVLGLIALALGWLDEVVVGARVVTLTVTLAYAAEAISDTENADGLWPIGAFLVAVGAFCGVSAVAKMSRSVRRHLR